MILYLSKDRVITAYCKTKTEEQENSEILKGIAVRYTGDFNFFMGEDIPGKQKKFYLNKDNTIHIEYVDILPEPNPPLTEQEQIAIDTALNVEYMVCLMEANLG